MHKIGEGVYAGGDHPQMERPFLVGVCNEDGNKMVFITQEGTYIGRYNSVLRIEVIAFFVLKYGECSINKMCFSSPEINCIHSIGQSFCFEYDEDFIEKGIVQLRTNEFSAVTTEAETFEYNSKIVKVTFGAFPIFINYDKQDNISDTTKYEDHFVAENRLIAISKSGRSMDSEDVQNFLNATERGIDVQLFVRKNKDDKISKEFYYLGRVIATGNAKQFVMPNTDKTAVEIEWELETPVREDIYQYIVNE